MIPRPSHALEHLIESLKQQPETKRWFAFGDPTPGILEEMGRLREPAALLVLLEWINHNRDSIRTAAQKAAEQCIRGATPLILLQLESRIREFWIRYYSPPDQAASDTESVAGLRVATLSTNGRVRERAVRSLAARADLDSLPFILLRLNDWVGQVRAVAEQWFTSLGHQVDIARLIECLPIISALTERSRGTKSRLLLGLVARIESESTTRDLLRVAMESDPRTRRMAFDILARKGDFNDPHVQGSLLAASNPILGVMLIRQLRMVLSELPSEVVRRGLASRSAMLRRCVLYNLTREQVASLDSVLRTCLLDGSKGVRQFAQYHLSTTTSKAKVTADYETLIEKADTPPKMLAAAILGYHEMGGRWTPERYQTLLSHSSASVRQAAITVFADTHLAETLPLLVSSLNDCDSPAIAKVAFRTLKRHPQAVDIQKLENWACDLSKAESSRMRALALISRRGKWERLPILLRLLASDQALPQKRLPMHLESWLRSYNRSQVQPTPAQITEARQALSVVASRLSEPMRREFETLLQSVVCLV